MISRGELIILKRHKGHVKISGTGFVVGSLRSITPKSIQDSCAWPENNHRYADAM